MKFRRPSFLLLLLFSLSSTIQASSFHLVTESFPPLNMTNNGSPHARNDRVSGFATDIMRQLFSTIERDVDFTLMRDWDKAYNSAKDGAGYGVYSTFRTPEREEHFLWVGPLYKEDWVILAPISSDITINALDDLKNFTVGSYESDGIADYLREQQVPIVSAKNDAVNVVKLKLGKIQLWATSSLTGPYFAANFKVPVKTVYTFSQSDLWLAMNKETDPNLVAALNTELKKMHQEGDVKKIMQSYYQH